MFHSDFISSAPAAISYKIQSGEPRIQHQSQLEPASRRLCQIDHYAQLFRTQSDRRKQSDQVDHHQTSQSASPSTMRTVSRCKRKQANPQRRKNGKLPDVQDSWYACVCVCVCVSRAHSRAALFLAAGRSPVGTRGSQTAICNWPPSGRASEREFNFPPTSQFESQLIWRPSCIVLRPINCD